MARHGGARLGNTSPGTATRTIFQGWAVRGMAWSGGARLGKAKRLPVGGITGHFSVKQLTKAKYEADQS